MLKRTPNLYDRLIPYLDGTLDDTQRAEMDSRLAADPLLAAEADRLRRTLSGLRGSASRLGPAEHSEVPVTLWPRLKARLDDEVPQMVLKPRMQNWWLAGVGATAAAGMIVAAFWLPGWRAPELAQTSQPVPAVSNMRPPVVAPRSAAVPPPAVPAPKSTPPTLIANGAAKKLPVTPPQALITPQKVASVPAKPAAPEYSVGDPFALPPVPAYYTSPKASHPAAIGSVVDEQRRLKITGNVQSFNTTAPQLNTLPRDRVAATTYYAAPAAVPSPATAQAQKTQIAAVNGAGGVGGGFLGGANQPAGGLIQHGQTQTEQTPTAPTVPAPKMGKMAFRAFNNAAAQQNTPQGQNPQRFAAAPLGNAADAMNAFDAPQSVDTAQASLAAALQPPTWGETERVQQANQALMSVKMSGKLEELRVRLEARQAQSPSDIVTGRMLASVYEFGFSPENALRERRRITTLENAVGEDWFALAQLEEKRGNGQAARTAYRRALESSTPPTPFHAAIARGRS